MAVAGCYGGTWHLALFYAYYLGVNGPGNCYWTANPNAVVTILVLPAASDLLLFHFYFGGPRQLVGLENIQNSVQM